MITTAIIAFREFLEAFLIIGIFLGVSNKLKLKKEKEILLAVFIGIISSLILSSVSYLLGDRVRSILTESNADILEGFLMIFSGIFMAYIIFSLHKTLQKHRDHMLSKANHKLQQNVFDISLFFTIVLMVLREGFEISLFTASISIFSSFLQNFIGLLIGLTIASFLGLTTLYIYIKFPINKMFKITEYLIILTGAALTQRGISIILEKFYSINFANMFSFNLRFLPNEETFIGNLLQGFIGIDQTFSFGKLLIMIMYILIIYYLFKRLRKTT
jgi:high-affinity iron transporter